MKNKDGYILVHAPYHPSCNWHGYVMEHILVMEQYLGCAIPPGCHVHHRDENRANNIIENLLLMRNASDHMMLHNVMSANRLDLVKAYEDWSLLLMKKLKDGLSFEEAQKGNPMVNQNNKKIASSSKTILRKSSKNSVSSEE